MRASNCNKIWHNNFGLILATLTILSALWISPLARGQEKANSPDAISSAEPVSIEAYSSHDKVAPGDRIFLALKLTIGTGWHINSNKPGEEFLIPTEVSLGEDAPVTVENLIIPRLKVSGSHSAPNRRFQYLMVPFGLR